MLTEDATCICTVWEVPLPASVWITSPASQRLDVVAVTSSKFDTSSHNVVPDVVFRSLDFAVCGYAVLLSITEEKNMAYDLLAEHAKVRVTLTTE